MSTKLQRLIKFSNLLKKVEVNTVPVAVVDYKGDTKANFDAETALTAKDRKIGMSSKTTITEKDAMFFDTSGPFWMKDVPFDIDLLFLTKRGTITGKAYMKKNTQDSWYPPYTTKYALEISGGLCHKLGIRVGDKVVLNIP